jgi:hypothetical protein
MKMYCLKFILSALYVCALHFSGLCDINVTDQKVFGCLLRCVNLKQFLNQLIWQLVRTQ